MEGKNTLILLAMIIAFFTTLFIGKQQVAASGSTTQAKYILTNKQITSKVVSDEIAVETEDKILLNKQLLEYKIKRIKENLKSEVELDNLEKRIRALVGKDVSNFGMVYYDINSKKTIAINADKQFLAASTIKVPINMLMYDMIQDEEININEKLKFIEDDYEDGAGILQSTELEKPIAIKILSDYSIKYSDNIAINMLLRKVGNENRYDYIQEIAGHTIAHEGNSITPMVSFKILERLYTNPDDNKHYSNLVETMKKTEYHDRIDKYIPKEIVAHKIGDFGDYVNDVGIVCKEENPYIFVVFTKEIPEATEVIAKVSKMIYDAQK
jgi:beta-lactamase class A